ncbi:MAG: methyltransferase [Lachnospiraceae bacterium]|nr:methyltransferase [Lachnospiraceae bacterium]
MGIAFDEKEMEVVEVSRAFRDAAVPIYKFPVTMKEAWRRMALDRKPLWFNTGVEVEGFFPSIIPDNTARGFSNDGGKRIPEEARGGKDMFGIEWVYVPVAGGSMEKPGTKRLFDDANDWKERIVWPDIDSWDWEGSAKQNEAMLNTDKFVNLQFLNGFGFERLISFMGFEDAAVAIIDEDQQDALKELFDKLSDLYVKLVDKCCQYYKIDGFLIHDDWGTQRAPFFSVDIGREMLVPYMRKVTDHIHSLGKTAELHSCGCNELQIENFIAGGWDIWGPMASINDTYKLFENYGDKIIIGVSPEPYDKANDSDDVKRAKAKEFVDKFCTVPGKVAIMNRYFAPYMEGVYAEEMYRDSRIACTS